GIRAFHVTGVQTCALPISSASEELSSTSEEMSGQAVQLQEMIQFFRLSGEAGSVHHEAPPPRTSKRAAPGKAPLRPLPVVASKRSEERRVGEKGTDAVRR